MNTRNCYIAAPHGPHEYWHKGAKYRCPGRPEAIDERNEAVRKALVNGAGAGTFTDRYLRERIVPKFLLELRSEGYHVVRLP